MAVTDDDFVADGGWLRAIASVFTPRVSCVTRLIMPLAIDTPTQAFFEQFPGFDEWLERRSFNSLTIRTTRSFRTAAGTFWSGGSGANTTPRESVTLRLGGLT